MNQQNFQNILKQKRDYYGNTETAIEFAAEELSRQCIQYELNKNGLNITCPKCIVGNVTKVPLTNKYNCSCGCSFYDLEKDKNAFICVAVGRAIIKHVAKLKEYEPVVIINAENHSIGELMQLIDNLNIIKK